MDSRRILNLVAAVAILTAPKALAWHTIDLATHSGEVTSIRIADDLRLSADATTLSISGNGYDLSYPVAEVKSITPVDSPTGATSPASDSSYYTITPTGVTFTEAAAELRVTDTAGRTVMYLPECSALSFGSLPAGVYLISAEGGKISLKVIVK